MSLLSGDTAFGPGLQGRFDFTLAFENIIFTLLPCSLFIVVVALQIHHRRNRPAVVKHGSLFWAKMIAGFCFVAVHCAILGVWAQLNSFPLATAASAVAVASSLALVPALYKEHLFSTKPSLFLGAYHSLTVLFNVVKARSYALRADMDALFGLAVASGALSLAIVILQECSKRSLIIDADRRSATSAETLSGYWSRTTFFWTRSILLKGYKSVFDNEFLPNVEENFAAAAVYTRFQRNWEKIDKNTRRPLFWACMKTIWPQVLVVVLPKLVLATLMNMQPIMTQTVVHLAGQETIDQDVSGSIIGASVLLYFGIAISTGISEYFVTRQSLIVRNLLQPAIYSKLFKLPMETLATSNALTLTSADVDTVIFGVTFFNMMWQSAAVSIGGLIVLGFLVKTAAVFAIIPTVLTTIMSLMIAKYIGPAQKKWNARIDRRLTATKDSLANLVNIKMSGLGKVAGNAIQNLIVEEIDESKKARRLAVATYVVGEATGPWLSIVVLATALFWTKASTGLSKADIFAILSVCTLITDPLASVAFGFSRFSMQLASLDRIQEFLLLPEHVETREPATSGHEKCSDKSGNWAVQILEATTFPTDTGEPVISNLTLQIPPKMLTLVVGSVGSGKSTLLKTIIGEVILQQGRILVNDEAIAYCDETTWLQNTTLKENIVGSYPFVEVRYDSIISACSLLPDIQAMKDGHETIVGDDGCNLSGGQRKRVALARAIYTGKPILVLDGPFNGLDRHTATEMYTALFGPNGILTLSGATTIMATADREHLRFASHVVTLARGKTATMQDVDKVNSEVNFQAHEEEIYLKAEPKEQLQSIVSEPSEKDSQEVEKEVTVMTEAEIMRLGAKGVYRDYFRSMGMGRFVLWLLWTALAVLATRFPVIYIRIWYNHGASDKTYFAGFALISLFSTVLWMVSYGYWYTILVADSVVSLHHQMLETIMHSTLAFITGIEQASLLNRLSEDMAIFSQQIGPTMTTVVTCFFAVVLDFILACSASAITVILVPICVVPVYFLQKFYLRTSRQMRQLAIANKVPMVKQIGQVSSGIQHIRSMKMQDDLLVRGFATVDTSTKPIYLLRCIQQWLAFVIQLLVMIIAVTLVAVAVSSRRFSSDGSIGVSLVALIPLGDNIGFMIKNWMNLEVCLGAMTRIKWFKANTPTEKKTTATEAELSALANWPKNGNIEFSNVYASYGPGRRVLEDVTFSALHGQNFGLTGRTGSGKSSILLTALQFLEYEGTIHLDGVELRTVPLDILRSRITTVTQRSIALPGTIRANLDPYPNSERVATDADMITILSKLGLWDEIIQPSGGLDAEMADLNLSLGQRQLVNIARAVLHHQQNKTKLAIMDEVTTGFDEDTALQVLQVLEKAFADCTVLMVEHRSTALKHMDYSLKLSSGRVMQIVNRVEEHHEHMGALLAPEK